MRDRPFNVARDEEILSGGTMDVYFERTLETLGSIGKQDSWVRAELTVSSLPRDWGWAVLCGTDEAMALLDGRGIDAWAMDEGSVFTSRDVNGTRVPVMAIEGPYSEFARLETPLLGLLCHASGVATMAARCRVAAGDATVMAFGIRRMHPAIAPMLDRASYIGGCDGVSSLIGSRAIGESAMGTMPHALMLMVGDERGAFAAYDEAMPPEVPRVALVDTFSDERFGLIAALESMPGLEAVRLDTPSSRKGSMREIVEELRWELRRLGREDVGIILSGGMDERSIAEARAYGVDGFGVGTSITNAPTIDLSLDLVEVGGVPIAKRGKAPGRKYVRRCAECGLYHVTPSDDAVVCACGGRTERVMSQVISSGRRIVEALAPGDVRSKVVASISDLTI